MDKVIQKAVSKGKFTIVGVVPEKIGSEWCITSPITGKPEVCFSFEQILFMRDFWQSLSLANGWEQDEYLDHYQKFFNLNIHDGIEEATQFLMDVSNI